MLGALVLALGVALLVQGYTHHLGSVSDDAVPSTASTENVPAEVHDGGPVIDASGADVRTAGPPEQTIALTFDDGPDPTWTPRILEVLEQHDVHATFFIVGTAAIDHPDLVRRMLDEGHEIGVHTLTHVDLGSAPPWQQELEDAFWAYTHTDENSDRVGEFAIGTNIELTRLIGNILQDEKFPGIHIAFGNPYGVHTGADWYSSTHIDVVGTEFDIWVDDTQLMQSGTFMVSA